MSGYKARRVVDDGEANDPIMQFSIIKSSLRGNEEKKVEFREGSLCEDTSDDYTDVSQ